MTRLEPEARILKRLLSRIGTTNRVAVEFGAKDGVYKSNTAQLRAKGWRTFLFDSEPESDLVQPALITSANINDIFSAYGVPQSFDVLSIDIDGNDLWVWEALTYQPRVVVIEYNPLFDSTLSMTVPNDDARVWDRTNYYGASVRALCRLGRRKGYRLTEFTKSNLIFVQTALATRRLRPSHVPVPRMTKRPDPLQRAWQVYA
jgi:hypothetical protein